MHRVAAAFGESARGEPIEPQLPAALRPRQHGAHALLREVREGAQLVDPIEAQLQRGHVVDELIPAKARTRQFIEQRLVVAALVGEQQPVLERALGCEHQRRRAPQRIPRAAAIEGVAVEIAGDQRGANIVGQAFEQRAHLNGAMFARAMDLEMHRHGNERRAGAIDCSDHGDVAAEHALDVKLVGLGTRHLDQPHLTQRPARQQAQPEQALVIVLPLREAGVVETASGRFEEQGSPRGMATQRGGEFTEHVAISRARHAEVGLVDEDHIGIAQVGMFLECLLDARVAIAVLDIPVRGLQAVRLFRCGGRRRRIKAPHLRQQSRHARLELAPLGARVQGAEAPERRDGVRQCLALCEQSGIAIHGCEASRGVRARRCAFVRVAGSPAWALVSRRRCVRAWR